jgi:hypothetical protein
VTDGHGQNLSIQHIRDKERQLNDLDEERLSLVAELRQSCNSLDESGVAVPDELIERLQRFRSRLTSLCYEVYEIDVAARGSNLGEKPQSTKGLALLLEQIRRLLEAAELQRHLEDLGRIDGVLSSIAVLRPRHNAAFGPLEQLKQAIAPLQERISKLRNNLSRDELEALSVETAPYEALSRLVRERDRLSMEEALSLSDRAKRGIAEHVVMVAALGHLVLESPTHSSHARRVVAPETVATSEPSAEQMGPSGHLEPLSLEQPAIDTEAARETPTRADEATTEHGDTTAGGVPEALPPNAFGHVPETDSMQSLEVTQPSVGPTAASNEDASVARTPVPHDASSHRLADQEIRNIRGGAATQGFYVPRPVAPASWIEADDTVHAAARRLQMSAPSERTRAANDLIWCLVREGRLGPAYHLARYLEANEQPTELPALYIEALIRSSLTDSDIGGNADWLRGNLYWLTAETLPAVTVHPSAHELIILAIGLRPALLAREVQTSAVIEALSFGAHVQPLAQLQQLAATKRNFDLTPALLKGDRVHEQWQQNLKTLQRRCDEWLARNQLATIIYRPTTNVWHRWLQEDGYIGRMLHRVLRDQRDPGAIEKARAELRNWSNHSTIDKYLDQSDRELRGGGARRRPIEARALTAIRDRCAEALSFLNEWLQLFDAEPDRHESWRDQQAHDCRASLLTLIPQCKQLVAEEIVRNRKHLALTAAYRVLDRALDDLLVLIGERHAGARRDIPAAHLLHGELPRIPRLLLDSLGQPIEPGNEAILAGIASLAEDEQRTWVSDLEACWRDDDYEAAARILEVLDANPALLAERQTEASNFQELSERHGNLLREARATVHRLRENVEKEVQRARLQNLITEDTRLELMGRIASIGSESAERIWQMRAQLEDVQRDLHTHAETRIQQFRQQLDGNESVQRRAADRERLLQLIKRGDLVTAHDFLAIIERGGELPAAEAAIPGIDFFPEFFEKVRDELFGSKKLSVRDLASRVRDRSQLASLDLGKHLTPSDARRAEEVLNDWHRLAKRQGAPEQWVRKILDYVGFAIKSLRPKKAEATTEHLWYDLETEPLANRDDCILPDYGSRCAGRYGVVCFEGTPLEGDILKELRKGGDRVPVLAFFSGRMSERRRRDLAHALHRSQRTERLLILDDVLFLYICLQKRRMPAFFNAASQFGTAEPYTTAAGVVLPEMFFGREREIESVFQAEGTNLVYGGRQLGKTALLREVWRRNHNPQRGIIVEFFDLRHREHLGLTRPMDDIWVILAGRLSPYGIVSATTRKPETLHKEITTWLAEERNRRIVLLLDEADIFLSSDAKEAWLRVGKLKSIMDDSKRRFKVVFAGLHNVQRTSHDVNTPLAHLGKPICIGPFLSTEEMRDAAEMVELPFRAMGYRFESPELVLRILAQANFYPSLIQIFCKRLLELLTKSGKFDPNTPPYSIRIIDVEAAHTDRELLEQIRERFRWTLELDNRYRVIALCMAIETNERIQATAQGFSLDEIRSLAHGFWPEGFEAQSRDDFRALLREMEELGILRAIGADRYAMRSPNFIGLLGSQSELWHALEDASKQPPKIEYDAAAFRRVYDEHTKWRRSPLTAEQESLILDPNTNGLFVLMGTEASGIREVVPFLKILATSQAAAGCRLHQVQENIRDRGRFQQCLDEILSRREEGVTVIVVPRETPWGESWVGLAGEMLARRSGAKKRFLKLIFLAGPSEAWWWCGLSESELERIHGQGLVEMTLAPWADSAVKQWRREAELGVSIDSDYIEERLREATGHWCGLLLDVGQRCATEPHRSAEVLDEYQDRILKDPATLPCLGLLPETLPILATMAEYGEPLTLGELQQIVRSEQVAVVSRVIHWATLLSLLNPARDQTYCLDPFVEQLLRRQPRDAS